MTRKRKTVIFIMVASMLLIGSTAVYGGSYWGYLSDCLRNMNCYVKGVNLVKWTTAHNKYLTQAREDMTGEDMSNLAMCMGYCEGVIDATRYLYDIPDEATLNQLVAIVNKYVKGHPEEWDCCASDLVVQAIRQAYPKKKGE